MQSWPKRCKYKLPENMQQISIHISSESQTRPALDFTTIRTRESQDRHKDSTLVSSVTDNDRDVHVPKIDGYSLIPRKNPCSCRLFVHLLSILCRIPCCVQTQKGKVQPMLTLPRRSDARVFGTPCRQA